MATQAVQRIEKIIKERHAEIAVRTTQFQQWPQADIVGKQWLRGEGERCLSDVGTFTRAIETGQMDAIAMCVNEQGSKCLLSHMGFDACGFDHKQCPWLVSPGMAQESLS